MSPQATIAVPLRFKSVQTDFAAFAVGFFFSFRLIIVLIAVRIFGSEPGTGTAVSLALGLLLLGFICFDHSGSCFKSFGSIARLLSIRWVFVFLSVSCCSLAWSETASLLNSLAYWSGLVTDVAIVTLLLRSNSAASVSHSLMKGFIWSTCLLALVAWLMPVQSDLRLGDEQFFNTNEIGNLCAVAIFFAQFLLRRRDGEWRLAILFLAVTLLRSLSKSTLIAFLLSQGILLIQDRSMSRKTKMLLMTSVTLLIIAFWGLFEAYYEIYTTSGNQAETLTGRTAIWIYVLNAASDHPWNLWIGHGFDSWWKVVPAFAEQFEARHAENEVLQQFYAYGVLGVAVLAGLYGSLLRQVRRLPRSSIKILLLSLLLFVVVRGLAVADPFEFLFSLWAIILVSVLAECDDAVSYPRFIREPGSYPHQLASQ